VSSSTFSRMRFHFYRQDSTVDGRLHGGGFDTQSVGKLSLELLWPLKCCHIACNFIILLSIFYQGSNWSVDNEATMASYHLSLSTTSSSLCFQGHWNTDNGDSLLGTTETEIVTGTRQNGHAGVGRSQDC